MSIYSQDQTITAGPSRVDVASPALTRGRKRKKDIAEAVQSRQAEQSIPSSGEGIVINGTIVTERLVKFAKQKKKKKN